MNDFLNKDIIDCFIQSKGGKSIVKNVEDVLNNQKDKLNLLNTSKLIRNFSSKKDHQNNFQYFMDSCSVNKNGRKSIADNLNFYNNGVGILAYEAMRKIDGANLTKETIGDLMMIYNNINEYSVSRWADSLVRNGITSLLINNMYDNIHKNGGHIQFCFHDQSMSLHHGVQKIEPWLFKNMHDDINSEDNGFTFKFMLREIPEFGKDCLGIINKIEKIYDLSPEKVKGDTYEMYLGKRRENIQYYQRNIDNE